MFEVPFLAVPSLTSTGIPILDTLRDTCITVLRWIYSLWVAIFNNNGALVVLRPFVIILFSIFIVFLAIRLIKSTVWGA